MFCKHCGTKLNDGAKFCAKCGNSVSDTKTGGEVTSAPRSKEFKFARTWLFSTIVLSVVLTILFGLVGSYEDGFTEPFIGVLMLSALFGVLTAFIIKWRKKGFVLEKDSGLSVEEAAKYKGLGGWLILVIIGLFAAVALQAYGAYESITLFTNGTAEFLSDPSSEVYIPSYAGVLKFELVAEIIFLAAAIYLIYLFFRKSKLFPNYYIIFLIASAVYVALDYGILASMSFPAEAKEIIDEALSEQGTEIARAFIGALIWGSYMAKSKRVKATFIEA